MKLLKIAAGTLAALAVAASSLFFGISMAQVGQTQDNPAYSILIMTGGITLCVAGSLTAGLMAYGVLRRGFWQHKNPGNL